MLCAVFAIGVMANGTIPFSIQGVQVGDKAIVSISSDAYLTTMTITADGDYSFQDVPAGTHYIKAEATGYNVQDAQKVIVNEDGTIIPVVGIKLAITKMEPNDSVWTHSWHEDGSVSGYTTTAHVNTPPEIEFLGKMIVPSDVPSFGILQNEYKVLLVDEEETWTQEYAYRLVETFKTLPINYNELENAKFILTAHALDNDILVTDLGEGKEVRISKDVFQYANPFLVNLDGVRGKFYSKRLHHALTNFVTDYGNNEGIVNQILHERFGCQISGINYEELTRGITDEDEGRFQKFVPSELVSIINMFEELPEGFHQTPHLNYLIRRRNGHPHPLYPMAAAVAWCTENGYIEFMESTFGGNNQQFETLRLILHEKTHFLWAYSFSKEIKNDWIELGGWYIDPNSSEGWATTKDTEFVTAYAHGKNPNEDMAESVAYYLKDPELLQSRAPEKYEFIRDRIMHGVRYISKIPDHLTFEVLNLYPDYDYPGKIKRLDVKVEGAPEEDKKVTVEIELNNIEGYEDGASEAFLRMTSPTFIDENGEKHFQYRDLWLYPVDGNDHILRGTITDFSRYSKTGYWTAGGVYGEGIEIHDLQGNARYEGRNDYVWNMYIDNPLEDLEAPKYESGSLNYEVTDTVIEEHKAQNLHISFKVTDNRGIKTVVCRLNRTSNYTYDDIWGTYDAETQLAHINVPITEFWPTGDYSVDYIEFYDWAETVTRVCFSDSPMDEPVKKIHITTPNPDMVAPELDLDRMFVYAEPTHPESPDGETIVTINCYIRDDKSGLGRYTSYLLRDPQGVQHHFWAYHRNTYSTYFDGDPTVWERYTFTTILPVGSAPGIWGLAEMNLGDKAGNNKTYNFVETIIFEPDDSQTDYVLFTDLDENSLLTLGVNSESLNGYGYRYRVICDSTGQEINGNIHAEQKAAARIKAANGDDLIDLSEWPDGKVIVIVQVLDEEGNVTAVRSKTLIKTSETRKTAELACQKAMEVYQNYLPYYEGDGMAFYQHAIEEQASNDSVTMQIFTEIEQLENKISVSSMPDEDKVSYLAKLNEAKGNVSALKFENDSILSGNAFYNKVQQYYESVVAFHDRLPQYMERIETTATIDELKTLIAEIEQDAENVESSYLNPVVDAYQSLKETEPRLVQISEELEKCEVQIQLYVDEVDIVLARIAFMAKKTETEAACGQAMEIYQKYMSYYDGDGMLFYQQLTEGQSDNHGVAEGLLNEIEKLESDVSASGMTEETKVEYFTILNELKGSISALKIENDTILSGNAFYDRVQERYEDVAAYRDRVSQYLERIEAATVLDELNILLAEVEQDAKEIESSCLNPVISDYQGLEEIEPRLVQISEELEECEVQFQSCANEISDIITGIADIINAETIVVYTMNGFKQTMQKNDLKSLPNGIYIINGKKYVVKNGNTY